ncbi:MAG: chemotaxis protein CheW [Ekhidna sp.]
MALGKNLTKNSPLENLSNEGDGEAVAELAPAEAEDGDKDVKSEHNEQESLPESLSQFCVFKSLDEEYAIPINLVKEVVPFPKIASVSQMPNYIIGMTNVRGNIYGVMDLGAFFSNNSESTSEYKYLLVLEHDVFQMAVAIPDVPDTLMASEAMIEKLSAARLKSVIGQKYLKGIIKKDGRMIILFDILGIISSEKFTEVT